MYFHDLLFYYLLYGAYVFADSLKSNNRKQYLMLCLGNEFLSEFLRMPKQFLYLFPTYFPRL